MRWITDTIARYGLECIAALLYGATVSGLLYALWAQVLALPLYIQLSGGVFAGCSVFFATTYLPWWWRNRPNLVIRFDEMRDQAMNPLSYGGENVRYYRVEIYNQSHQFLGHCSAEISDIIDSGGDRPLQVPKFLEFQLQPGSKLQAPIPIQSKRSIYANLVSMNEFYPEHGILLRCASGLMPIYIKNDKTYFLEVTTYAVGGVGNKKWFQIFVDQDGRLRCWVTRRPSKLL